MRITSNLFLIKRGSVKNVVRIDHNNKKTTTIASVKERSRRRKPVLQ
jgi:hypothetical protein